MRPVTYCDRKKFMTKQVIKYNQQDIENRIFSIRGIQVMIDSDLADMYGVETKVLNQAVKRSMKRFPNTFRFQLTEDEYEDLKAQTAATKHSAALRSQSVTSSLSHGGRRYLPYVFTEQGVAMLSAVLRSETAIEVSIQIMDAFVKMRQLIGSHRELFERMDRMEVKLIDHDKQFEKVFKALESGEHEDRQGVFFDGQTFDAYALASKLIRSAKKSIYLVDNYVDDSVLLLLTKRKKGVSAKIFTKTISNTLKQDLKKHNEQYEEIELVPFDKAHDRFLIIDGEKVYHIGASLKDLGKKWFAFSLIHKDAVSIIDKLKAR